MNEQLQNALAAAINKAAMGIDTGTAFLQAELPLVIQELLQWKLYSTLVSVVVGFLVLGAYSYMVYRAFFKRNKVTAFFWDSRDNMTFLGIISLAFGGLVSIVAIAVLECNIKLALQIWLAPKIFLIEYAASLAK